MARAESAKIFLNSFVKMPDYHFPTCFSHKEIARLDFLSCTKWKQIEANSVCSAEESRIGEILCCYSETEQNRARYNWPSVFTSNDQEKKNLKQQQQRSLANQARWNIWERTHTCGESQVNGTSCSLIWFTLNLTSIGFTNFFRCLIYDLFFFTNADVVTIKNETSKENSWNQWRSN